MFTARLSRQLLARITLLILLLITLFTTVRLAISYQVNQTQLAQQVTHAATNYLQPLAISLWEVNDELTQQQLQALSGWTPIARVEIQAVTGKRYSYARPDAPPWVDLQRQRFVLRHLPAGTILGTLDVYFSLDPLYQNLVWVLLETLLGQGIEFLLLMGGLLYLLHRHVLHPLKEMAAFAATLDNTPVQETQPLALPRLHHPNELEQLALALNEMRLHLVREQVRRDQEENQLAQHRDQLALAVKQRTQELEEALRRLSEITAALGEAVYVIDEQQRISFVNPALCRQLGWEEHELLGQSAHDLFHYAYPDRSHFPAHECPLNHIMLEGKSCIDHEDVFWHRNGYPLPVILTGTPLVRAGKCVGAVVAFRNISARLQMEAALRQSESRWQFALEGNGYAVWDWNPQTNITYYSAYWYELFGIEPHQQVSGTSQWEGRIHPDDMQRVFRAITRHLQGHSQQYAEEYRCIRNDGEIIWVQERGRVVEYDAQNQPLRMIGTISDISDRKLVEQRQQDSNAQLLRVIVDAVPEVLLLLDRHGHVLEANPTACLRLGQSRDDIRYRRVFDLFAQDAVHAGRLAAFEQAVSHGHAVHLDDARLGREFSQDIYPITNQLGQIDHVVVFALDVTEQRQQADELRRHRDHLQELVTAQTADLIQARDAAEAASRAKSTFLATMSHEIRTPLNGILGMTELMLQSTPHAQHHEYLLLLRSAAVGLLNIMNDMLDFAKVEAGRLELEQIPFNLVTTVREVSQLFSPQAQAKGLLLTLHHAPELTDTEFIGDPQRLQQILSNLISNALKFTPDGTINISVDLKANAQQAYDVTLAVQDSGIGIPQAKQAQIFEAFMQADASTTRHYGGTGLGLSICRELVQLMGGQLMVESTEGEGSRFYFTIPLSLASQAQAGEIHLPTLDLAALSAPFAQDPITLDILLTSLAEEITQLQQQLEQVNEANFSTLLAQLAANLSIFGDKLLDDSLRYLQQHPSLTLVNPLQNWLQNLSQQLAARPTAEC